MKRLFIPLLSFAATWLVACQPALLNPPRLATQAARTAVTSTPAVMPAATPTAPPLTLPTAQPITPIAPNATLTLWVDETSATHRQALQEMTAEFGDLHGVHVELVLIDPDRLLDLVETAAISDTLPDLIVHPLQYTAGWVDKAILSAESATAVADSLGRDTFNAGALDLVATAEGLGALPSDGWQQIVIYRADWFAQLGLEPPSSYEAINRAAQQIYRSEIVSARTGISNTLLSGLVVPTESDLLTTQYVFEQIATANGCELVDNRGAITFIHPNCLDALDFYRDLVNGYSPSDVQTDISALNAYRAGRTGMIVASPQALPILAGLTADLPPVCAECQANPTYLAENSGVITHLTGRSPQTQQANFGQMTNLGITRTADHQLATLFAEYWFTTGYPRWLAVEPERKVPLRRGTAETPTQFIDLWYRLPLTAEGPTLSDLYGIDTATQLAEGLTDTPRWGFRQGQGALITDIYRKAIFPIVLQEMLSGYFTSSGAVIEAYERVVALIPNYAYDIESSPPAAPEN